MSTVYSLKQFPKFQTMAVLKKNLQLQYQTAYIMQTSNYDANFQVIKFKNATICKQPLITQITILSDQKSQKYRIISRGIEKFTNISKALLRKYLRLNKENDADKKMQTLCNIINNNHAKNNLLNNLSISMYPMVADDDLVYLSYVEQLASFMLVSKQFVTLLNRETTNSQLQQNAWFYDWMLLLGQQQKKELVHQLSKNTFVGKRQDKQVLFFQIIHNQNGGIQSVNSTKQIFKKIRISTDESILTIGQKHQEYEDVISKLQSYIQSAENCYQIVHKIFRVMNNDQIILEFVVINKQLAIYQKIIQSIENGTQFVTQKGHFPQLYYGKLYQICKQYYQSLKTYKIRQIINMVLYSEQMRIPMNSILQSSQRKNILKIHYSQFENCSVPTFLIYLIIGPSGMGKSQIISNMRQKTLNMGCQSLVLKMDNHQKLEWNQMLLEDFMKQDKIFKQSQYAFIFFDFPFHPDIPQIINESVSKVCPSQNHFIILHVMPAFDHQFSFKHEILNKQISFPFQLSFLIYCLKSIQKRGEGYNKKLQPIENLSKLVHSISFNFRNFRQQVYEGSRLRMIKVDFGVRLKQVSNSIICCLEELLQVSYKKQYMQNEHILYYVLQALQSIQIVQNPDMKAISEDILVYSFRKLPYFCIQ